MVQHVVWDIWLDTRSIATTYTTFTKTKTLNTMPAVCPLLAAYVFLLAALLLAAAFLLGLLGGGGLGGGSLALCRGGLLLIIRRLWGSNCKPATACLYTPTQTNKQTNTKKQIHVPLPPRCSPHQSRPPWQQGRLSPWPWAPVPHLRCRPHHHQTPPVWLYTKVCCLQIITTQNRLDNKNNKKCVSPQCTPRRTQQQRLPWQALCQWVSLQGVPRPRCSPPRSSYRRLRRLCRWTCRWPCRFAQQVLHQPRYQSLPRWSPHHSSPPVDDGCASVWSSTRLQSCRTEVRH